MLSNPGPMLDNLDKLNKENPELVTLTYQKFFGMPEGQLILIDLMDQFFEFRPATNPTEVGSENVLKYIKNRIYGVTPPPEHKQQTEEQP